MTIRQLVGEKEVSVKTGLTVVLFSFAAIFLLSRLFTLLTSLGVAPLITSTLFWLSGGAIAAFVFFRYSVRFLYTLDGVKLAVERVYSRKPRFMEQLLLREIIFIGSAQEALKKHGNVKIRKAVRKTNAIVPTCILYKRSGEIRGILIQANEELLSALHDAHKK